MTTRKIIMDCDPGHDDAIAIILAAAQPTLEILAITTVSGNAEIEKTTDNALKICDLVSLTDVMVSKGASEPLVRLRETAPGYSWGFRFGRPGIACTIPELE